ncbi:MAG: hypothetical protein PHE43_00565 [Candidatus Nanoarchaeia archaeon]|nr:hypothetical protein [Candidatus Nanoarchaeia archaeon]
MVYKSPVKSFDFGEILLPSLATYAAWEIDMFHNGVDVKDNPTKNLSEILEKMVEVENPRNLSPDEATFMIKVISGKGDFEKYFEEKDYGNVALQIYLASKDLRDFKTIKESQQMTVRKFCLDLSREFVAHYYKYPRPRRYLIQTI